jgi:hypothetical protein
MTSLTLYVGRSDFAHGVSWNATMERNGEADHYDAGGWDGELEVTVDAWMSELQRRVSLPRAVAAAGLGWDDASVRAVGSPSPEGIRLEWSW